MFKQTTPFSRRVVPIPDEDDGVYSVDESEVLDLRRSYEKAISQRKRTVKALTELITKITALTKDTNIAKLVGNSGSLVGTVALVTGLFCAPFTSGMSLVFCAIPGGTLSVLGSVTANGASLVNMLQESNLLQLAKSALEEDDAAMKKHRNKIGDFFKEKEIEHKILKGAFNLKTTGSIRVPYSACKAFWKVGNTARRNTKAVSDIAKGAEVAAKMSDSSSILEVPKNIVSAKKGIDTGVKIANATGKNSIRALVGSKKVLTVSKSAFKATLPVAIITAGCDIYDIVSTSINMKHGNISVECGKLNNLCQQLELELEDMKRNLELLQ